jgi:hypothetical protein
LFIPPQKIHGTISQLVTPGLTRESTHRFAKWRYSMDCRVNAMCSGRPKAGPECRHNDQKICSDQQNALLYTSLTFFSGRVRTGFPIAAWMALSTAGATTQIVGSPTPPQKS